MVQNICSGLSKGNVGMHQVPVIYIYAPNAKKCLKFRTNSKIKYFLIIQYFLLIIIRNKMYCSLY